MTCTSTGYRYQSGMHTGSLIINTRKLVLEVLFTLHILFLNLTLTKFDYVRNNRVASMSWHG